MPNNNLVIGLVPQPDAKGTVNTREINISAANAMALGINSPYVMNASGEAIGATTTCSGTILGLKKLNGVSVASVPASTAGYKAIVTTDKDQIFQITVSGIQFTDADNGKAYNFTAETLVANIDGFNGNYSRRQLDGATEAAVGAVMTVSRRTGALRNDPGVDKVEVFATITPAQFVQA